MLSKKTTDTLVGGASVPISDRADAFRVGLVRRIKDGHTKGIKRTEVRRQGHIVLSECVVHLVNAKFCICGGWNSWEVMVALITPHHHSSYGFGPACAAAITRVMGASWYDASYSVAIVACKTGNPREYLKRREFEQFDQTGLADSRVKAIKKLRKHPKRGRKDRDDSELE